MTTGVCSRCGHVWADHSQRRYAGRCLALRFGSCPCDAKHPDDVAEDRRAAFLWNSYLGRDIAPPSPLEQP